jgi:Arc/MetJ-type ribon-helix-helix transcriptional regulator
MIRVALRKLRYKRKELQGDLKGLENKLQVLLKKIESKRRVLELVEATERQLAAEDEGQPDLEGDGSGPPSIKVGALQIFVGSRRRCTPNDMVLHTKAVH